LKSGGKQKKTVKISHKFEEKRNRVFSVHHTGKLCKTFGLRIFGFVSQTSKLLQSK
jgi:hypothetical protein